MEMRIVIPTRGRVNKQVTLAALPPELRKYTALVCPPKEVNTHTVNFPAVEIISQPDQEMTIAAKRAWILRTWGERCEKIVLLDDDMTWFVRIKEGDWHLRYATPVEMVRHFEELDSKLSPELPHAGFGARQGNNRKQPIWESPTRSTFSLAYYLPVVLKECELGRIETREDMDYTLQLLRKGYPNAVNHAITGDQTTYGAPGGCTGQRTLAASNADAYKLAELHPGYVRVVEKQYKNQPRCEVVCSWGKALRDGQVWRASQAGGAEGVS